MFINPKYVSERIRSTCYNGTLRKAGSPYWSDGLIYAIGNSIDNTTRHTVRRGWNDAFHPPFLLSSIESNTKLQ